MNLRAPSYAITLILAACGSEEAFEPQVGSTERLLDTSATAQFGSDDETFDRATVVGDLDGDGIDDAVIRTAFGTSLPDGKSQIDSKIYVLYGGQGLTGAPDMSSLPYLTGAWGFQLGSAVTGVGDVDGDGLADMLVVGARNMRCFDQPGSNSDELRTGAYLVYGSRARVAGAVQIAGVSTFLRDDQPCSFITSVTALGDLDGDGKPDFAVARTAARAGETTEVMAFYGRGARMPAVVDLVGSADAHLQWHAGQDLTPGIARLGDVDHDGFGDFVIRDNSVLAGDLRLVRGSATRLAGVVDPGAVSQTAFLAASVCNVQAGFATPLGDLDGDGADDFALLGCPGDFGERTYAYRLFYGRQAGFPAQVGVADADATLPVSGAVFGNIAAGDLDGDGISELVVGAPGSHSGNGGVHVMKGTGRRLSGEVDPAAISVTYVGSPRRAVSCDFAPDDCVVHEHAGDDVSIGDLTGDGHPDLFVQATGSAALSQLQLYGSAMDRAYIVSHDRANP